MKLTRKVLHNKAKPWVFTGCDFQTQQMAKEMLQTMRKEKGIGLAAPQIGISRRVFVMHVDQREFVCFNPEIIGSGSDLADFDEGCLSFPGDSCNIKRPKDIRVRYRDAFGNIVEEHLEDLQARCFQHELDHLDGITMWDRYKEQNAEQS